MSVLRTCRYCKNQMITNDYYYFSKEQLNADGSIGNHYFCLCCSEQCAFAIKNEDELFKTENGYLIRLVHKNKTTV